MNILISGSINIETTVVIRQFPIKYYPVDYPFFGIKSHVGGVGYNLTKALTVLGNAPTLLTYHGNDKEGMRLVWQIEYEQLDVVFIDKLAQTPISIVLYDKDGRRQIYSDLKNLQKQRLLFDIR
ncbi:PfkB family carbohydrate kinase [uncultured Thomasclavelia sp.]|uniref:PfkB family carbohydrate kinase n=1 Tax=uncultured Thomasclavelia sp. TaxID=3025759 RepID=UPI0025D428BD|nr:PfkB family carbohydrate kinase [uncultured Thomasclavelia sp.]